MKQNRFVGAVLVAVLFLASACSGMSSLWRNALSWRTLTCGAVLASLPIFRAVLPFRDSVTVYQRGAFGYPGDTCMIIDAAIKQLNDYEPCKNLVVIPRGDVNVIEGGSFFGTPKILANQYPFMPATKSTKGMFYNAAYHIINRTNEKIVVLSLLSELGIYAVLTKLKPGSLLRQSLYGCISYLASVPLAQAYKTYSADVRADTFARGLLEKENASADDIKSYGCGIEGGSKSSVMTCWNPFACLNFDQGDLDISAVRKCDRNGFKVHGLTDENDKKHLESFFKNKTDSTK